MKPEFIAIVAAATVGATSVQAETLIASTYNAPAHFAVTEEMQPFMDCVEETSGGDMDFSFFPSSQIADGPGQLDALKSSLAQIAYVSPSFMSDQLPLTNLSVLPDMGNTSKQMVSAMRKVLEEGGPISEELEKNDLHPLMIHMNLPYQVGLGREKIESLADFSGLKLRVSGGAQGFGVTILDGAPIKMSAGDSYIGMQQGTIDGYLLALTSIDSYKLQEVSKSISTNANFAGGAGFIATSQTYFDSLSPERQEILSSCGLKIEESAAAYLDQVSADLEKKFTEAGVDMFAFPDDVLAEMNAKLAGAADDYIARLEGMGLKGREAYDQYRAALSE